MKPIKCLKCKNDISKIVSAYQKNSGQAQFFIECTYCGAELGYTITEGVVTADKCRYIIDGRI